MSLPGILSLGQFCLSHSPLQSQPQSSQEEMAPQIGPMSFKKIKFLMRTGVLANTELTKRLHTTACKLTTYPLCAACQFGKQRQRSYPWKRCSVFKDVESNLKKDKLISRQCIAVDHYMCSTKGRLFTSRGKTKDTDMYTGGALFMDMSSK